MASLENEMLHDSYKNYFRNATAEQTELDRKEAEKYLNKLD